MNGSTTEIINSLEEASSKDACEFISACLKKVQLERATLNELLDFKYYQTCKSFGNDLMKIVRKKLCELEV